MGQFDKIESFDLLQAKLEIKKAQQLEKIFTNPDADPTDIMKADQYFRKISGEENKKSHTVDPMQFQQQMGFKEKPIAMTYQLLRNMSKTPIINSIIKTRINQVCNFSEPQRDKYQTGYVIQKKKLPGMEQNDLDKLSKKEEKEIYEITEFIQNCGVNKGWDSGDFEKFLREITRDSLIFDQYCFENIHDRKGRPHSFFSVDAATIRISDAKDDVWYEREMLTAGGRYGKEDKVNGYYPSFVQTFNNEVVADYYPWELCFGVRNPTTDIYSNGYGISELEDMVHIITSMLWSDEYNRNFFKQGSMPKGFLRYTGNMNNNRLSEFRQMWYSTMRGVYNAWKTPIIEADKVDWVDLQKSNRDMEFTHWIEYLIKLACAIYVIDPAEVNFPLQGGANESGGLGQNNEYKINHSKDRGLKPLLRHIQKKINKFVVAQINPKYEFIFVGLDGQTREQEMKEEQDLVKSVFTIDEVREKRGLKPLKDGLGDTPLESSLINAKQQAAMAAEQDSEEGGEEEDPQGTYDDPGPDYFGDEGVKERDVDSTITPEEYDGYEKGVRSNDIEKSWDDYLKTLKK